MKFSTLITAFAGVNVACAARFTKMRKERHDARALEAVAARGKGSTMRLTNILPGVLPTDGLSASLLAADTAAGNSGSTSDQVAGDHNGTNLNTQYTQNWAGNVLVGPSNGWKSVTGTFVVPTPKTPTGGSATTTYAASIWVGIDGATSTNSILQTGIDVYVQGTTIGFDAWYEWYPDYAYDFSGITIAPGDTIQLTVTATSATTGTAAVKNVSKGVTVYHSFTTQSPALSEVNAEWIVEDFQTASGYVPFANFGTVTFTSCQATGPNGPVGPSGGTLLDIQQNGQAITQTSLSTTSSSSIIVKHL